MARKRMIDPSFWADEKLGTVDPVVRLLFMGLISQADDEGKLNGHPSLLRSLIFPYDHEIQVSDVDGWLSLLSANERKLIFRYEVDHQKYISITNFKKHQTINKPQKSKLPNAPSEYYGSTTVVVKEEYGIDTAQKNLREEKGKEYEEKGKEEPPSPSEIMNNPHERHITNFLKQYNVIMDKPYPLEQFFSYIGAVDIEVIEVSIKKSSGKSIAYCLATLQGQIRDGVTKESLKIKVGEPSERNGTGDGGNVVPIDQGKPKTLTELFARRAQP